MEAEWIDGENGVLIHYAGQRRLGSGINEKKQTSIDIDQPTKHISPRIPSQASQRNPTSLRLLDKRDNFLMLDRWKLAFVLCS